VTGSLLSWDSFPSRVCSGMAPGTVSRIDTEWTGWARASCISGSPVTPPRQAGPGPRPWVLESRIRWSSRSIEPLGPPSGGDPV
jgi:hypothetical protein